MSARERRKFDDAFKEQAVRLISELGKSPKEVALDLGINEVNVRRWLELDKKRRDVKAQGYDYNALMAENKNLRKKLKDAQLERDILKKATAIFSKNHG